MASRKNRRKNKVLPKNRLKPASVVSLEEKIQENILPDDNPAIVREPRKKMSEVILEFAWPIMENCESFKEQERIINFIIPVWNICVMPEDEQKEATEKLVDIMVRDNMGDRLFCRGMLNLLFEKKEKDFADKNRPIVSYVFSMKDGKPWLDVASIFTMDK